MHMTVGHYRPFNKNTLQGFLTLNYCGLSIKECTHHTSHGKEWIGFPAREFKAQDGSRKWVNLIEFLPEFDRNDFQDRAIAAVNKYLADHPPSPQVA